MRRVVLGLLLCGCAPADDPPAAVSTSLQGADAVDAYVVLGGPGAAAMLGGAPPSSPAAAARVRDRFDALVREHAAFRGTLEQHGAVVIGDFVRLGNGFHVRAAQADLERIARLPEVARVEPVPLHQPFVGSAMPLTGAPMVWQSGFAGDGIRIGIVDTGIDYLHADLGGAGDPAAFAANDPAVIEPGTFPTARVIGGWDFAGNGYDPMGGQTIPFADPDPLDCDSHGTHVAGIAAGNGVLADGTPYAGPYDQGLDPAPFRVSPGVAPRAALYALKIFGCSGGTLLFAEALERAVDPDENGDLSDRLDVVNASLGTAYGNESAFEAEMVHDLTAAGTLLVAAAGNEGNSFFALGSPSSYAQALSVAATFDTDFVTVHASTPPEVARDYAASEGNFAPLLRDVGPLGGVLVGAEPALACEPLENAGAIAGKVALVDRGDCLFVDKTDQATAAGAIAVVIANHDYDGDPFFMTAPDARTSSVPVVMIGRADGDALRAHLAAGVEVTLEAERYDGPGAEGMAGLSSRGPSAAGFLAKPEIAAVGADVLSAGMGSGIDPSNKSGTSMATPFVAGAAALVRQARPELGPTDVKALLVSHARQLSNVQGAVFPVSRQGAGRLDVSGALASAARLSAADPDGRVGVAFSPMIVAEPATQTREVVISNDGPDASYALDVVADAPLPGVTVTVEPATVDVAQGQTATVTLRLDVDPAALGIPGPGPSTPVTQVSLPRHWLVEASGKLRLFEAGSEVGKLHYHGVVRAAARRHAGEPRGCGDLVVVPVLGEHAHPEPVVGAFELGAVDEVDPDAGGDPAAAPLDVRAMGAASDAPRLGTLDGATVSFAVAVGGIWGTPARGRRSGVLVAIDLDGNDTAERLVVVEPFRRDGPFADVPLVVVYDRTQCSNPADLSTCPVAGARRFAGDAPAGTIDTAPYVNDVLVLPAFARDLGLVLGQSSFRYQALTLGIAGAQDETAWAVFDALAPQVDPLRDGDGNALDVGDLLRVRVAPGLVAPPQLLVIHPTNVAEERWETLDVSSPTPDTPAVEVFVPDAAPGTRAAARIVVSNDGEAAIEGVEVEAIVGGGIVEVAAATQGSCDARTLACGLGTLGPGAEVTITLQLLVTAPVGVVARARSASGCESKATVQGEGSPAPAAALEASGGCGCRVRSGRGAPWAALLLLALFRARRVAPRSTRPRRPSRDARAR
jgi:subtilisin family serine protease